MKKSKLIRPSADETRHVILQAARRLFIQHGFAGASMSQLAAMAGVNQSLISHHFGNKKKLWQQVKAHIIADTAIVPINPQPSNLRAFLSEVLYQQFMMLDKQPELIRLLSWQRLEPKQAHLMGGHNKAPMQWLEPICFLQKNKQVKTDLNPEFIMIWIASSVTGMLADEHPAFKKDNKQKKLYLEMMIEGLTKAFAA